MCMANVANPQCRRRDDAGPDPSHRPQLVALAGLSWKAFRAWRHPLLTHRESSATVAMTRGRGRSRILDRLQSRVVMALHACREVRHGGARAHRSS
jgi:hypothetical protein